MANSNQKYGVWDSHNDMAISLSPASGNPELCSRKGCNGLVGTSAWNMGYRMCENCLRTATQKKNERSEQNTNKFAFTYSINDTYALERNNEQRFKRALQNEEMRAQREEWIQAIPKDWSV